MSPAPFIKPPGKKSVFTCCAEKTALWSGHPAAFLAAFAVIILWCVTGPLFGFSDTWQLVINTGTTIITFLMVFLIQNSQNRDTKAIHLKLDELIRSHRAANTALLDLEELSEEELTEIRDEYEDLAREARKDLRGPKKPQNRPKRAASSA
jgi:low affinity Fe/Cu permease